MAISCGATDKAMMARCIELSRVAASKGEYPFGTVIALNGQIVADLVAPVYSWFTEGFDTADLKETKAPLLDQLA